MTLTLDILNKMYKKLLDTQFKYEPLMISPKAMELLLLDMEWQKLGKVLYNQKWLKYNLQKRKYPRKKLPLPN